jgi:DNA-binding transcriptional regulator PaaX
MTKKEIIKKRRLKLGGLINKYSGLKKEWFSPKEIEQFQNASLVVMTLVGILGLAAVSTVAPNALQILGKTIFKKQEQRLGRSLTKREKEIKTAQIFYYLKRSGLITLKPSNNDLKAELTKKGELILAKTKFGFLKVPKKVWDGKWWQVAADIPTLTHRTAADMFRKKIKSMGFYALQRTLWFYPFDPRKELQLLAEHYNVEKYITVMEISRMDIEDEKFLKQHFAALGLM